MDGELILPRHLAKFTGKGAEEYSAFNREKRQWFLDHGVNPGDWNTVYPILKASWAAHGIPSAEDRHRLRVQDDSAQSPGGAA